MVLGHLQQGGNPTPFDRVHAARLAAHCIDWLTGRMLAGRIDWHYATLVDGKMGSARLVRISEVYDIENRRPKEQWWTDMLPVMDAIARGPMPGGSADQPATSS